MRHEQSKIGCLKKIRFEVFMNKKPKGRLLLVSSVICILVLLSISTVYGVLKPGEAFGPSLKTEESADATLSRTMKSQVALSSNPRQVLELSPSASDLDPVEAQTCGLMHAGYEIAESQKGPMDCTDQSSVTLTETFYNLFTYSGGRVSWWTGWAYGTIVNGSFPQPCENPPLVITASRPISYWRQGAGCITNQTVIFTANTGQVIQKPCSFHNSAEAEFIGSNITQVTITAVPNTGTYIGGPHFIEEQPCECPNIPVVP